MIPTPPLNTITLGKITIHLYGVIIACAMLICYALGQNLTRSKNIPAQNFEKMFLGGLLSGIIGARVYHVAINWNFYAHNILQIPAIWNGGLGIFGAIAGGIICIYAIAKINRLNWKIYTDIFAVIMPLGQAIGRWGNYLNQELFGTPTNLPWKLYIDKQYRPKQFENNEYFHPTFLYESILNLINFTILYILYTKKQPKPGIITGIYLLLYGSTRFIVDFIKINPDEHINTGILSVGQWISIATITAAMILIKKCSKTATTKEEK